MSLRDLKKEMPYKWKVQTCNEWGATCVAYIDSRLVQDVLDDVVGPDKWQNRFSVINGLLFCEIGILTESGWVWKGDTGTESREEKEKGIVSDAFKRAGVQWGIGRFLYSLDMVKIKEVIQNNKGKYVPASNGKQMYPADINRYCEAKKPKKEPKKQKQKIKLEKGSDEWNRIVLKYAGLDVKLKGSAMAKIQGDYEFNQGEFEQAVFELQFEIQLAMIQSNEKPIY